MVPSEHLTRNFIGYGAKGYDPRWPDGARLALNLVLNVEEGAEPSVIDGDATSEAALTEGGSGSFPGRDLAAESMFEYGSRVGFWRLSRLLDERGLPATVMACALALERNPEISHYLRSSQFDVCAHGWRWEQHRGLSLDEERERISRTVRSIQSSIGSVPEGWYCRYGPSVNTRNLLVEHGGFSYDSDAYNDELPYWVRVGDQHHLVVPYSLTNNDAKFMRGAMATAEQFFQFLRDAFDFLYAEGKQTPKMMSVGLHLRIAGHPGRAAGLQRFLDHVSRHDGVWVCRRGDIARHWHQHHQP
ncbi:allantoinase PuuE [Rhizobium sp. BK418]|uniref:allantoinase PuuE n=1 Tax=Rhizobium sp. BK418 TaxID=2512120 RepID=UPI001048EAB6|nr:allantoinase PuuE [Rhizobium sp. BK418]TCR94947.1 peptidoglycan/xylan/chitin deacetylase (PgdA/CDA1 family) [Rhizobium sp. BK418]